MVLLALETYPGDLSAREEGSDVISVHPRSTERFPLALGMGSCGDGESVFNGRASPPLVAPPENPTDLYHGEEKLSY